MARAVTTGMKSLVLVALLGGCACSPDHLFDQANAPAKSYGAEINACITRHDCEPLCESLFTLSPDETLTACHVEHVDAAGNALVRIDYDDDSVCAADGGGDVYLGDSADNGSTDDGSTDDGGDTGSDDGSTNDGSTDDGSTNDGSTDDGSTNDGSTDDGSTNDGSTNDGSMNDGSTDPTVPRRAPAPTRTTRSTIHFD
jgi:hypothetical protein